MDIKPRQLQAEEASTLANFAELAARHIEKDLYLTWQKQVGALQSIPATMFDPCACRWS